MTFGRWTPQDPQEREAAKNARNAAVMDEVRRQPKPGITMAGATAAGVPKVERAKGGKAERDHKDALAQLGCMVCRRLFPYLPPGPVELHHLRGGGWGRGDWTTLIPLCLEHHRGDTGVHGLGTKAFDARYGFTQADLLMDAMTLLGAQLA